MPIYSGNRTGSAEFLALEADMSYGPNDMARIMYESECNDQMIFEAVLKNDFMEIKGIREGTILESELTALNEASKKHLIDSLKISLSKTGMKISGALKNASNAVAAYVMRDGKAYANIFEKKFAQDRANFDGKVIQDVKVISKQFIGSFKLPSFKNDFSKALSSRMNETGLDKTVLIQTGLQGCIPKYATEPVTPKQFTELCMENAFETVEINDSNVDSMAKSLLATIKGGSALIKSLKATEADTKKALLGAFTELKAANKKGAVAEAAADETEADAPAAEEAPDVISNLVVLTAAYQTVVAKYSAVRISITKKSLKYARAGLAKILAACKTPTSNPETQETVAQEARMDIADGIYEINEAFATPAADLNTSAIRSFVEAAAL